MPPHTSCPPRRRRRRVAELVAAVALSAALARVPLAHAFSALDRPRDGFLESVLESNTADQKYCQPSGLIQDACCDFETVESVNDDIFNRLHDLVATPYFRSHKVDLFRECPFWQEDGSCMNRACGVETLDEEHILESYRSSTLSELKTKRGEKLDSACSDDELPEADFCVVEDELDSEGQYVDLMENPERFTGYAGASASRVWKAIYEENCFSPVPFIDPSRSADQGGTGFASLSQLGLRQGGWGESEKRLVGNLAGPRDKEEDMCLEKRVFYRLISGLHASISIHICDEYLDQTTGEWSPNLDCFVTRIAQHPERLQNVYFAYVVALRAFSKSRQLLVDTFESTSLMTASDIDTRASLDGLLTVANGCPSTFDETSMFSGPQAQILKSEFKSHFRNVSRIMDCVGCDKCRLWGKLQVTGLGTALKLLFSDGEAGDVQLSRSELVAFVNTLHRFSESLRAVERFRGMWRANKVAIERGDVAAEAVDEDEGGGREELDETEELAGTGARNATEAGLGGMTWFYLQLCRSLRACFDVVRRGQTRMDEL